MMLLTSCQIEILLKLIKKNNLFFKEFLGFKNNFEIFKQLFGSFRIIMESIINDIIRKFDIETKKKISIRFLKQKFLNIHEVDFEAPETLLYGVPQSGKSAFTFANAYIQLSNGKSCIFIVRNYTKDAIHIQEKAKRFSASMVKEGFESFETVYAGNITCKWKKDVDHKKIISVSNHEDVEDALFGTKKKLVVILANFSQLSALNYILEKSVEKSLDKLVSFVDEADAIGYGMPDIPTNIEYNKLKEYFTQKFEITATPWDNFANNDILKIQNIVMLQPPPTYKGITNIEFHELSHSFEKFKSDLVDEDPNFREFYDKLGVESVFGSEYNTEINHPIIVLHKTRTDCKHHQSFFNYFRKNYKNWVVIKEDSDGLFMFSNILLSRILNIAGKTFTSKDNGVFDFKDKIIIPQLFQWFIDNGGANVFSHIVIKSGRFSGRSRSYVSMDGNWHLTHQYYLGTVSVPGLIQEMRIVHDRPDSIPLKCYAPLKTIRNIQNAAVMMEEQIERIKHKCLEETSDVITDFIKECRWRIEKLPSKKIKMTIGKVNSKFKVNKVVGDDGGWSIENYEKVWKNTVRETEEFDENTEWYRRDENGRLERKDKETCVQSLRRLIREHFDSEKENHWKTAREWLTITGLCGFKNRTSYHYNVMTHLVKEGLLERKENKLRVKM